MAGTIAMRRPSHDRDPAGVHRLVSHSQMPLGRICLGLFQAGAEACGRIFEGLFQAESYPLSKPAPRLIPSMGAHRKVPMPLA